MTRDEFIAYHRDRHAPLLRAPPGSEAYLATIRPDEARVLDPHACEFVLSTETAVIA